MRAVVCRSYGTPEDLVLDEVPDPVPGPGQLLVRVRAAAVNFPDVLFIAGKYQVKIPPPFIPGNEIAGEVIAAGEGARFVPGQRVAGTTFGAFAEQALLNADQAEPIPDDADFASAAAFGVTYRTAYHALRSTAGVTAGDWVVVLGAAGGSGWPPWIWRSRCRPGCWPPRPARRSSSCAGGAGRKATVDYDRGASRRGSGSSPATAPAWSWTRSAGPTRSRPCAAWPAAAPSSPWATRPAPSRPFRSISFCSKTSACAAWRSAPS